MISENDEVARRFVKKMTDKKIIREWKCDNISRYYINPIYTMTSRDITLDLYKLFKNDLDPHLTDKAKDDLAQLLYCENDPEYLIKLEKAYNSKKDIDMDSFLADLENKRNLEEALENSRKILKTKRIS